MRRLWLTAAATFLVAVAVDVAIGARLPGELSLIGLLGAGLLILGAKWLGGVWLQRPPDYYERVAPTRGHEERP